MIKHLFVINPNSGKFNMTGQLINEINVLHLNAPYEICITESSEQAAQIIREQASTYNGQLRIYACGGDGTFSTAVNACYKYPNAAVAPVPIGSGNDFVRGFENIEKQRFLDLNELVKGSVHQIDILMVGQQASVNMVTVGYDCAVAKEMERFKKLPMINGSMAYNISLIYCLISKIKNTFTLVADGETIKDDFNNYLFAIAANGKYYGGGYNAAPTADIADGFIDFIRIPTISRLKFLQLVSIYKRGEHLTHPKMGFIKIEQCKTLQILADNPIDVNIDGEIKTLTNPEIIINEKAAKIILPTVPIFVKEPNNLAFKFGVIA